VKLEILLAGGKVSPEPVENSADKKKVVKTPPPPEPVKRGRPKKNG